LTKKSEDLSILKSELNQVKEFRKKKVQMQKELEEVTLKLLKMHFT
jgi:hypothetical protein